MTDTIFALSSGMGRAGIAVFRIAGPNSRTLLDALTQKKMPDPRKAALRKLYAADGTVIDEAVILLFAAPHSYTGDDLAELHVHGSRAVIDCLTQLLPELAPCRLAEPGEFTRRAFENGKLDLTRAEAVADLIDAETEAQRAQAVNQLGGALGDLYEFWRSALMRALAHIEAELDFPDEDLPEQIMAKTLPVLQNLEQAMEAHLNDGRRGERLRDGIMITIIGAPNAGKSTLLNALAQRDVAIVSDIAGTTRDVLDVHLNLNGYPVIVADTAGLRDSADTIEKIGIARARAKASEADLKIALFDAAKEADEATSALIDDKTIIVWNKADLKQPDVQKGIPISAQKGTGLDQLLKIIGGKVADLFAAKDNAPALTRARHREALIECLQSLQRAKEAALPELFAEDIRLSMRSLGKITGRFDVEDLLDIIFRDFCIGK